MSSDPQPPAAPSPADDLQFDRAESTGPPPTAQTAGVPPPAVAPVATTCVVCNQPIADAYFEANGKIICPRCREMVMATMTGGSAVGRLARATLYGVVAGVGGAALWYGVERLTGYRVGLVAVVIGFMVGGAVRAGSKGRGGPGYQILAVLLAYLSIAMAYAPYVIQGWYQQRGESDAPAVVVAIIGVITTLVAPFIGGGSIISVLIVGFALWEAWRINRRRQLVFNGPYRLGPEVPPPAPSALAPVPQPAAAAQPATPPPVDLGL